LEHATEYSFARDQKVVIFADYVQSLGDTPRLSDIDLMAIYRVAPFAVIMDVERPSLRLKHRYVGTRIVRLYGAEITGHYVDQLNYGEKLEVFLALYERLIETGYPQWLRVPMAEYGPVNGDRHSSLLFGKAECVFALEHLAFPLYEDQGAINHVIAVTVPIDADDRPQDDERIEIRKPH